MDPFEKQMRLRRQRQLRLFLLIPVLLALVIGCGVYVYTYHINQFRLELTLNGEEQMILEYGQSYEEPGAAARFYGTRLIPDGVEVDVRTEGIVDEQRLGTYRIRYGASHERWHAERIRTVEIIDSVPPRIWLAETPGSYVIPGDTYREEGFMARDNYDGDLTDRVKKTVLKDKIIYEVEDSSGNEAKVIRNIVYYDPVPPVIYLEGDSEITLKAGQTYEEPGYSASDNCDGNLTGQVQISGSVDTDKPGTYQLIYYVEDRYGNSDTEVREIRVKEKPKPKPAAKPQQNQVTPSGKVIYLTFDDGPSAHTEQLLEILKKYDVKATFFVVKTGYSHLIDDIVAQGHSVAAHTYSHDYRKIYASEEAYFQDLQKILNLIEDRSGVDTKLLRFPGGSSNTISGFNEGIMSRLTHEVVNRGYRYFDWNVDSNDAGGAKTAQKVYENVINGVQRQRVSIVLQHDIKGYSVEAVEMIIQWGLENGYSFRALDENSPTAAHDIRN